MSRELVKYRAWNDNKKCFFWFANGRYYDIEDLSHCISEIICSEFWWINAEQYTGLKDINGVEIYEGDILLYDSHGKPQKTIIEYVDDMFHCKSTKYPNLSPGNYRLATLCESNAIIGNIREVKI